MIALGLFWIVTIGLCLLVAAFALIVAEDSPFVAVVGGLVCLAIIAAVAMAAYDEWFVDHPVFTLRTDRWACTGRHTEVTNTWVSDGKGGGYNSTSSVVVCDQYSRIAAQ